MNEGNYAVLISTYDGAEDLWKPLEESYSKYWNASNKNIYLTTNHKNYKSNLFIPLMIGDEISWSDNILKSLDKINEDYILLTFDDLFIKSEVNDKMIDMCFDWMKHNNANYFQLYNSIGRKKVVNEFVFEKVKNEKYRNATVFSLWKKDVLISILSKKENAWEFETKGNERSFELDDFYCSHENIISYYNGVVKGKWNPIIRNKLINLGYSIDLNERRSFTPVELLSYELKKKLYNVKRKLNRKGS